MRAISAWPEWLDSVWAKSPAVDRASGETLAEHTWTVLCRVSDLARLRPGLPTLLNLPSFWNLLFWAAFLHDWGKAATGFQGALRGGPRWHHRHEVLSLAFLDWVSGGFRESERVWIAATVSMHHRDHRELEILYPTGLTPQDDPLTELVGELSAEIVHGLWRWLAEVVPHWVEALDLTASGVRVPAVPPRDEAVSTVLVRGVQSIQQWLRGSRRLVRNLDQAGSTSLRISTLLLRGYIIQSDHAASAHVGPLEGASLDVSSILRMTGLTSKALYLHQQRAAVISGSALLTAPTGSGKTEAALLWAAHQHETEKPTPRLFYTLPYQASMNAMHNRLQGIFRERVGLLHGRSTLALYRWLMNHEHSPKEATRLARALRAMAALNLPPIRVFSPYQMLKAAYQLKGYETVLADYAEAAFVFDEIHAYEPQRLGMILETIRYLREHLGATFFVMSATLPTPVACRLQEVLGSPPFIRASPDLFQSFARHEVRVTPGDLLDATVLSSIERAFLQGQAVLVTCNTVARAQEVYCAMRSRLPKAMSARMTLVHGRFTSRDRVQKEQRILATAGLGRPGDEPVLVVSTQVVEVSLNIDLDTIFTDPAPLEALIQRFGRVNRKRRLPLAPVHVLTQPADGQGVYDPRLVQAALRMLATQTCGRPLDEGQVESWLDAVYQGPILDDWEATYGRAAKEFREAFLDRLRPFDSDEALEDAFNRLFDGLEVLPASLSEEYFEVKEQRPLEAQELLVPIAWRQWWRLKRAGCVMHSPNEWPPVVDVHYSPEMGLELARSR